MEKHCCGSMEYWAEFCCPEHSLAEECPDNIISFSQESHSYGIRVHDGGSSSITILHCPWCGSRLVKGDGALSAFLGAAS
jgi:hypothetical protein